MKKLTRRDFVKTTSLASMAACAASEVCGDTALAGSVAADKGPFQSTWSRVPDRYWTGPDTWANPWEDWQIQDGRLVCIKADRRKRSVHCLTHQLNQLPAEAEIEVSIQYCGAKSPKEVEKRLIDQIEAGKSKDRPVLGSAGFELGIRFNDPLDDYRSRLLFGKGLPMGINGQGELFIGRRARKKSEELAHALAFGLPVRLFCKIGPDAQPGKMRIDLTAKMPVEGFEPYLELASVSQTGIAAEKLTGNVALVDNFPPKVAGTNTVGLYAFSDWTIGGPKVTAKPEQKFGPILWTLYTLSNRVMKMTAQMPPLGDGDDKEVRLQVKKDGGWKTIATAPIDPLSWTATFRVADWDDSRDVPYRVCWTQKHRDAKKSQASIDTYSGTIRKDPRDKPELVVAGYCCFMDYLFPNAAVVDQTRKIDPDIMFFMGDQIYEVVGGFGILRQGDLKRMMVNYLRKLALLGWSVRDVTRNRPTVWMPDDHDVYQGNLWGAGGRKITLEEWKSPSDYKRFPCYGVKGGYIQPAEFVKAVERTQAAHLPDPYDPTSIEQGIGVYYTGMKYGGVSFAILEDRKFKSGPMIIPKHESSRADWITNRKTALQADVPGAKLLGDRQLEFLEKWVADWNGVHMKMAVAQTIFCNAATHHGRPSGFLVADLDSNGWPQSGRNAAIDVIRRGGALMLGGDQHLPTFIQHGIKQHHDAGFSFCVPAGAVGYQRWWMPEQIDDMHREGDQHDNRPNTGKYRDGFGNLIDVWAVANPPVKRSPEGRLDLGLQKSSGFGVVRMDKSKGTFTVEAWPVGVDPKAPQADKSQYPGWPAIVTADQCIGDSNPTLPQVVLHRWGGKPLPVVEVRDAHGELVTSVRMTGPTLFPRVFDKEGTYTVDVLMPEENGERGWLVNRFKGVTTKSPETLHVPFKK